MIPQVRSTAWRTSDPEPLAAPGVPGALPARHGPMPLPLSIPIPMPMPMPVPNTKTYIYIYIYTHIYLHTVRVAT